MTIEYLLQLINIQKEALDKAYNILSSVRLRADTSVSEWQGGYLKCINIIRDCEDKIDQLRRGLYNEIRQEEEKA